MKTYPIDLATKLNNLALAVDLVATGGYDYLQDCLEEQ